jgi:hypothetical protein
MLEGLGFIVPVIGAEARILKHQHRLLLHLSGLDWPLLKLLLSVEALHPNMAHAALFAFFSLPTFFSAVSPVTDTVRLEYCCFMVFHSPVLVQA